MKSSKKIIARLALVTALGFAGAFSTQAATYFSNYANYLTNFSAGNVSGTSYEIGDEVIMGDLGSFPGGKPNTHVSLTKFSCDVWATGFTSPASFEARMRFYNNDGDTVGLYKKPGNAPFWDSGWGSITIMNTNSTPVVPGDITGYTIPFTTDVTGVLVPQSFTWSVQFRGLGSGDAGVPLYSPPSTGTNITTYWYNDGTTWDLRTPTSPLTDVSFAASFEGEAVPEPAPVFMMVCVVGIGGLVAWRARSKRLAAAS